MGVARLSKVTIISPRSEYEDVARALAHFEDFHPLEGAQQNFDPGVQELTVKAVRLFAQADQAVKDLGLKLMPGQMDIVFRGVKIPKSTYEASSWKELLSKADSQLGPIADEVRAEKVLLQKAQKDEADSEALMGALAVVSGFSSNLTGLSELSHLKGVVSLVENEKLAEFKKSLPEALFLSQPVTKDHTLAMVAVAKGDEAKLDKAMKLLELKPLTIPPGFPQNPAEAYKKASQDLAAAVAAREKAEAQMAGSSERHGTELLALRELAEVARKTLDEARVSGGMQRMAMISGYIPAREEGRLKEMFGKWMVHTEPVAPGPEKEHVPTLMENRRGIGLFQPVTMEQGIPAEHEVDPTPLVSFVFPVFFGMMFGDVGHGLILTAFFLWVRHVSSGSMRQWANMFVVAGVSAIVFGIVFGEFFELSFSNFIPIPAAIEIIHRAAGTVDTFNFLPTPFAGINLILIVSFIIGIAHLATALGLDVYQASKENNRAELWLEKVPVFTMYLSGVGYGLAFVGVGFSFNVLTGPGAGNANPLLGIPNDVLGAVSLAVLVPSMIVLLAGKSAAIAAGKLKDGSALGALSNGGLEVFERISQFMSNTISYVRLAVMLLVHAALLLIVNLMQPWSNPVMIAPWIVLNLLILAFEAFIVYVQDLRLHLYEFFTKFYSGTGIPFRKIFPNRVRIRIDWL
ncbi:MAG TPA: V-type ATPase 116kDa subunit family protein [Nitrososphaerales archaeon]|nr:V-type ATPase 116kDa subunit family protein [Nitrososphaerales archaeon]